MDGSFPFLGFRTAQIHIRALGLFNNVCRQAEDSSEKALARRQLIVKPDSSTSWFVGIKHLHRKYELCPIVSSFSLHSKQVASVSVLYIRILLLCSIYDPVSNLSFTESLEMQIHIRALGLFNNVCRQAEDSSEKALAWRQLIMKPESSASWFVGIKHLHRS
jgi:hypothetical protein